MSSERFLPVFVAIAAELLLRVCTHSRGGPTLGHFDDFHVARSSGNTVHLCSAYCSKQETRFTFSGEGINEIRL